MTRVCLTAEQACKDAESRNTPDDLILRVDPCDDGDIDGPPSPIPPRIATGGKTGTSPARGEAVLSLLRLLGRPSFSVEEEYRSDPSPA